jgi:hypothetical protein
MTVKLITGIKNFIGLSTDSKPTDAPPGSTFWESNTNNYFKTHDGTDWVSASPGGSFTATGTENLFAAAGNYDVFTATGGNVLVERFTFTLPNIDVSDDAVITGITIQTDTTVPIVLLAAAAGLKANLTANASFAYNTPFTLPVGKKIILSIVGGTATANPTTCATSVRYASIAPAGYIA